MATSVFPSSESSCSLEDRKFSDLYFKKLKQLGFSDEDDPFISEESLSQEYQVQWSTSVELWPVVEFGNVYVFLIDCPGYTHQSLKAYKSLEAYNCFVNGYVNQLSVRQSNTGHSIIKGTVQKSEETTDVDNTAWVGINNEDGSILTGHCTCMISDGSLTTVCIHVAAIVFQVEAAPHLSCSKTNACLLCPYHQDTHEGRVQEIVSEFKYSDVIPCRTTHSEQEKCDSPITGLVISHNNEENVEPMVEGEAYSSFTPEESTTSSKKFRKIRAKKKSGSPPHKMDKSVVTPKPHVKRHVEKLPRGENLKASEARRKPPSRISESNIQAEQKQTVNQNVFECNDCNRSFRKRRYLATHLKSKKHLGIFNRPYACTMCDETFSDKRVFRVHVNSHDREESLLKAHQTACEKKLFPGEEKPHVCPECGKAFALECFLEEHRIIHTGKKPFKCEVCTERFMTKESRRRHFMKLHDEYKHKCDECDKSFYMPSQLKNHKRKHTGEMPFQCTQCGKRYKTKASLSVHQLRHAGLRPHVCHECGKGFFTRNNLTRHSLTHTGEKKYPCTQCGKAFGTLGNLNRHNISHTGEKEFLCVECGKRYTQKSSLDLHLKMHSGVKPFKCTFCEKAYYTKRLLAYHVDHCHDPNNRRERKDSDKFKCKICEKMIFSMGHLERHMDFHAKEKLCVTGSGSRGQFPCDVCGKMFASSKLRDIHVKGHKGENPHKCDNCERSFTTNFGLKTHMRIHTGEKPFVCNICKRGFGQRSNFVRHKISHMSEKPYKCTVCSKGFSQSSALYTHIRSHTGEKPFKCDKCGQAYTENAGLRKHMKKHEVEDKGITKTNPPQVVFEIENFSSGSYNNLEAVLIVTQDKPNST